MSSLQVPTLVKLSETDLNLRDPERDVRGRTVVDKDGNEVGDVQDVFIDEDDRQIRFLLVGAGGILGIGKHTLMIPVDTITRLNDERVQVDLDRDIVARGPRFNPAKIRDESFWADAYGHYGYLPFWAPGYSAPTWPDRPWL